MTPPPVDDSTLPYGDEGAPVHPRSGEPAAVTINAATHGFVVAIQQEAHVAVIELRLIRIAWESVALALSAAIARLATIAGWVLVAGTIGVLGAGVIGVVAVLGYLLLG